MTNALITARFDASFDDRLRDLCGSTTRAGYGVTGRVMDPVHFREALGAVDVLITEFEVMDAEAFAAAPDLRVLTCCRNEPHASVNIAEATARGIPVLFTPGRNARAVAEFTLGLVLDLFRGIAESHHALKYTDRFVSHGTTGEANSIPPHSGVLSRAIHSTCFRGRNWRVGPWAWLGAARSGPRSPGSPKL